MSQLSELESLRCEIAQSGCQPVVLSYGYSAEVGSLMADELLPFFQEDTTARSRIALSDVILLLEWHGVRYPLVVDLEAREFSMVSTLPAELRGVVERIAKRAGYAVTQ